MAKLRVGVVGVGYLGSFHAEKYARMEDVDLVGVVDTDGERAARVSAALGVAGFTDHRLLFGAVDAVSIAVPTVDHFHVGQAFLEHGVDVLIEKPITARLEEADALIALAESRGRILQVGHLERFNPAVAALQDVLDEPQFIESQRLSVFKNRSTDVSVVLDLMIHDIDIITNLVPSGIRSVRAVGAPVVTPQVDIANARLEFQNGCVANVTASRVALKNERSIRLFQKDAYICVDFINRGIAVLRQRACRVPEAEPPEAEVHERIFTESDALDDELKAFVRSVATRTEPAVPGRSGRKALEIALNIMEQIDSGRRALSERRA
jgi:predicted dehydrogenase